MSYTIRFSIFLSTILQISFAYSQPGSRIYGSYFGGSLADKIAATAVSSDGWYCVGGTTYSSDLPTTSASFNTSFSGVSDGYIAIFNSENDLVYCTYIGGSGAEYLENLVIYNGVIYFCGTTYSQDMQTTEGCYQSQSGGTLDIFIGSLSLDGTMNWLTHYGTTSYETGTAIAVHNDKVICVGQTGSAQNFVTADANQSVLAGQDDAYILVMSLDGEPVYCSYIGGYGTEEGRGIAIDSNDNVYICGGTRSIDGLATVGAMQEEIGGDADAFVIKLNSDYQIEWSTYYGGNYLDWGYILFVDDNDAIWVSGSANSTNLPVSDNAIPFVAPPPGNFILQMNSAGERLWSSYLGYDSNTSIKKISGIANQIVLSGSTSGNTLQVTENAYQPEYGGYVDGYILVLDENKSVTYYSYYGGENIDRYQQAVLNNNKLYVFGETLSTTGLTTPDAYQPDSSGGSDIYVAIFDFALDANYSHTVQNDLFIFPNPASTQISITSSDKLEYISIMDLSGRLIRTEKLNAINSATLDIQSFASGMYLLQVESNKEKSIVRFVVE